MSIVRCKNYISVFVKRRLRQRLRDYGVLRRGQNLSLIRDLKGDLALAKIDEMGTEPKDRINGVYCGESELAVRQFLLQRLATAKFERAIVAQLVRGKSVLYPLPGAWRKVLRSHGICISLPGSVFCWAGFVIVGFTSAICFILVVLLRGLVNIAFSSKNPRGPYVYFADLTPKNIPRGTPGGQSYDIISWYSRWSGRSETAVSYIHSAESRGEVMLAGACVEGRTGPVAAIRTGSELVKFIAWAFASILVSGCELLRGRWWRALLLKESALAFLVKSKSRDELAREYLFPFSGSIFRRLWTYEAERKGSAITAYFYTTYEQPQVKGRNVEQIFEFSACSWPRYLVWNECQATTLKRVLTRDAVIEIVGPICFQDSGDVLPRISSRSVAVFDIQKHRSVFYQNFSTMGDYFNQCPDLNRRFLADVYSVLLKYQCNMVFKKKREIGRRSVKGYVYQIHRLTAESNFVSVDPDISPFRVVKECRAVISMPFTSTAMLFPPSEKPSVYYDPIGWIDKDDPAAHGLPVLSGIDELDEWIRICSSDW